MAVAGLLESEENPWILVSSDRLTPCGGEGSREVQFLTAQPMQISTVFYSGLEGLGGFEMENDPLPQVHFVFSSPRVHPLTRIPGY